ncbi:hypothetical protein LEMLEM_LOCUS20395, partial [Lemmus lemmus]
PGWRGRLSDHPAVWKGAWAALPRTTEGSLGSVLEPQFLEDGESPPQHLLGIRFPLRHPERERTRTVPSLGREQQLNNGCGCHQQRQ